tara:strand:+ start:359 stop:1849 length:1491 start_codon:yes stop_codon:yes gene_type:complete
MSQVTVKGTLIATEAELIEAVSGFMDEYQNPFRFKHRIGRKIGYIIINQTGNNGIWNVDFRYEDASATSNFQTYSDQSMFTFLENLINKTKRRREEEERRRKEEAERRRKQREEEKRRAIAATNQALSSSSQHLENEEFEAARKALNDVNSRAKSVKMSQEIDDMLQQINLQLRNWMTVRLAEIQTHIQSKNWDVAKFELDQLSSSRVQMANCTGKVEASYKKLASAKEAWRKAEEARKRKVVIALATSAFEDWKPNESLSNFLKGSPQQEFQAFVIKNIDDPLINEVLAWKNESSIQKKVQLRWEEKAATYIQERLSQLIVTMDRRNVLTDERLAEGHPSEDKVWMKNQLIAYAEELETGMKDAVTLFDVPVNDDLLGILQSKHAEAEKEWIIEKQKEANQDHALRAIGAWLEVEGQEEDLFTRVSETYRGTLNPMIFHKQADGSEVRIRKKSEILELIQSGANLKIAIEECYSVAEQNQLGHLKEDPSREVTDA